ncbi:hypothetical protein PUR29_33165 [Methylobacterium ajmalii]|uniref:Uncharacterized protein n=1 Tax=Methylobacterium ajmalii TaxID=2738439 RepID=A0ABV0A606_9HYPH
MHRTFLAALALACVCSPAMAGAGPIAEMLPTGGNPAHGLAFGLVLIGALALAGGVCLAARVRLPVLGVLVAAPIAIIAPSASWAHALSGGALAHGNWMYAGPAMAAVVAICLALIPLLRLSIRARLRLVGCAVFVAGAMAVTPLLAAEVATVGGTSIDLPWGAWLAAAMPSVASVAVTILGGVASAALAKLAPWATLFISQKRIEATIQTGLDYGINAVQGATKDAKLTVPVGSQVLAVALQRIIDSTPAKIIDAVGGPAEIAKRLFRAMHLDENSSAALILEPILARLPATAR